jgi:hypothetical protein
MRAVAINVAANTNEPGVRGPIHADGSFEYVPIPESEPIRADTEVPTYADLELETDVGDAADRPVHLDPTFAGVHGCTAYTYGDPHGVKARPLLELDAGDLVFFYATLSTVDEESEPWIAPEWGAYIIGRFRLSEAPISGEAFTELPAAEQARFAENAHLKRDSFDAAVLLHGDPAASALHDVAIPLSSCKAGVDANRLVTECSSDSGRGPWWRRPMKFDQAGTETLLEVHETGDAGRAFE